jgi:hypothetical protein
VSPVEVVPLGYLESFHLKDVNRLHHGVNPILIIKILIKLTTAAPIIIRTGLEIDALLQVVDARSLGRR